MQMDSTHLEERWFTDSELVGLRDYWRVYEQHHQELQKASLTWALTHPKLGAALSGIPAEESERQGAISFQVLKDAIATGDFADYAQNTRPPGSFYAALGVRFRDWFDLISWFQRTLLRYLESAFSSETSRLVCAIDAMQTFLHHTMVVLGETYIDTKEAALRSSEERLRLLIESVSAYAIYTINTNGQVTSWSAGAERMKQYQPQTVIGQHFSRFFAIAQPEQHCRNLMAQAAAQGRAEDTAWHVRMDGSRYWCHAVISPLYDDQEQPVGFVCVNQDRTEAQQKEDALRHIIFYPGASTGGHWVAWSFLFVSHGESR